MTCLGLNVYLWGAQHQDRMLVSCMAPTVQDLKSQKLVEVFWFDRFDARGPHLFMLLTVVPGALATVRERLATEIGAYLMEHPSTEVLPEEELATRHAETRGKALCAQDEIPGTADNNSYVFFEQNRSGYPFWLNIREEVWALVGDLTAWSIRQLSVLSVGPPLAAAVRWMAGLELTLRSTGVAPQYWRYHAGTLLIGLEEWIAQSEEGVSLAFLERLAKSKNRDTFSRLWSDVEANGTPWPPIGQMAELAIREDSSRPLHRFSLLREIVHVALKQLGVPVKLHIPLVLFSWLQSCQHTPAPAASQ